MKANLFNNKTSMRIVDGMPNLAKRFFALHNIDENTIILEQDLQRIKLVSNEINAYLTKNVNNPNSCARSCFNISNNFSIKMSFTWYFGEIGHRIKNYQKNLLGAGLPTLLDFADTITNILADRKFAKNSSDVKFKFALNLQIINLLKLLPETLPSQNKIFDTYIKEVESLLQKIETTPKGIDANIEGIVEGFHLLNNILARYVPNELKDIITGDYFDCITSQPIALHDPFNFPLSEDGQTLLSSNVYSPTGERLGSKLTEIRTANKSNLEQSI